MRRRWYLFVCLAVLFGTPAVVGTGADTVTYEDVDTLELQPAGGENAYVQESGDGEISIVVAGEESGVEGVNDDAVTDLGAVFTVENLLRNGAESDATVWIEKTGETGAESTVLEDDSVTFYDADAAGSSAMETREDGVELEPGEDVPVGMEIDTTGEDDPEAIGGFVVRASVDDGSVFETLASDTDSFSLGSSADGAEDGETDTEPTEGDGTGGETSEGGDGTAAGTGSDTTAGGSPSEATTGGESDNADAGSEDVAPGLLELSGGGSSASLGVVGIAGGALSLVYVYRIRRVSG